MHKTLAAAACGGFLVLQVGVPTGLLFAPRPARFGWQMFSSHAIAPVVVAVRADGSQDALNVDDYFAFRRGDIAPASLQRIPEHICRVEPTAVGLYVRWRPDGSFEPRRCR